MPVPIDAPRYLYRFAAHDDSIFYDFPLYEYEWESEQGYRLNSYQLIGANYQHDSLGFAPAPVDNSRESIRALFLPTDWLNYDAQLDEARGVCGRIGIGKLYSTDSTNNQRWAWARLTATPKATIEIGRGRVLPLMFEFERKSDWFELSYAQGAISLTVTPRTFTITNPGNAIARNITLRLRSNSATGFTNPIIRNLTAGSLYEFASSRDAVSANSEIRIMTEQYRVEFSDNDGVSYVNDYDKVTQPNTQVGLMALAPGVNNMEYVDGGVPNAVLEFAFLPAYR
jgi:hypothetical protein